MTQILLALFTCGYFAFFTQRMFVSISALGYSLCSLADHITRYLSNVRVPTVGSYLATYRVTHPYD
jgi:hypothetical protein